VARCASERSGYWFPAIPVEDHLFNRLEIVGLPRNWIVNAEGVITMDLSGCRGGEAFRQGK
jgi:hypothetical protein